MLTKLIVAAWVSLAMSLIPAAALAHGCHHHHHHHHHHDMDNDSKTESGK
ncbi:hypothetical protein [Methylocystis parvus]